MNREWGSVVLGHTTGSTQLGRYIRSDSTDGVILLLFGIEEKSTDRYSLGCSNLAWIVSHHYTRLSNRKLFKVICSRTPNRANPPQMKFFKHFTYYVTLQKKHT